MGSPLNDYSITVHSDKNIFRIIGHGRLIGQAIQAILQTADRHSQATHKHFIVDLTDAVFAANVVEVEAQLTLAIQANLCKDCLLAVVHATQDELQLMRYQHLQAFYGLNSEGLKVFTDEGEARKWLGGAKLGT